MRLAVALVTHYVCFLYQQFHVDSSSVFSSSRNEDGAASCPIQCTCVLDQVWCANASLVEVPPSLSLNVTFVDLRDNIITRLPRYLSTYTRLSVLDLSSNSLHYINPQAFRHLYHLQSLSLNDNQLKSHHITASLWFDLTDLRTLHLRANHLGPKLHGNIFSPLVQLVELDVSANPIEHLSAAVFVGMRSLSVLRLKSTRLTSVPTGALDHVVALRLLDLSSTFIHTVGDYAFGSQLGYSLQTLLLDDIPVLSSVKSRAFADLRELAELSLSGCPRLRNISRAAFAPLCKLRILNLQHGGLRSLDNVFEITTANNNRFKSCTTVVHDSPFSSSFSSSSSSSSAASHLSVFLAGNPWHCDCALKWLRVALVASAYSSSSAAAASGRQEASGNVLDSHALLCASPPQLRGDAFVSVPPEAFACHHDDDAGVSQPAAVAAQVQEDDLDLELGKDRFGLEYLEVEKFPDSRDKTPCNSEIPTNGSSCNIDATVEDTIEHRNKVIVIVTVIVVIATATFGGPFLCKWLKRKRSRSASCYCRCRCLEDAGQMQHYSQVATCLEYNDNPDLDLDSSISEEDDCDV